MLNTPTIYTPSCILKAPFDIVFNPISNIPITVGDLFYKCGHISASKRCPDMNFNAFDRNSSKTVGHPPGTQMFENIRHMENMFPTPKSGHASGSKPFLKIAI